MIILFGDTCLLMHIQSITVLTIFNRNAIFIKGDIYHRIQGVKWLTRPFSSHETELIPISCEPILIVLLQLTVICTHISGIFHIKFEGTTCGVVNLPFSHSFCSALKRIAYLLIH